MVRTNLTRSSLSRIFLAVFLCLFVILPFQHVLADDQAFPPEIEKILALSEDKIDMGLAALTVAKQIYPALDIQAYSQQLDKLADEVKAEIGDDTSPQHELIALVDVIQNKEGFRYDFSADSHIKQDNYFLNGLLKTKRGMCQTMSILYMAVAQRLGLPVYISEVPGHTFVRLVGSDKHERNLEATSGGTLTDAEYVQRFHIPEQGIKSGAYLRTMSHRESLAILFMIAAQGMRPTTSPYVRATSIAYFEKAVELNPRFPEAVEQLRGAYEYERMLASLKRDMKMAASFETKANDCYKKTEELGFGGGLDE
jgi:regulator of sirC expression with transglutaminase-like and TPR domain